MRNEVTTMNLWLTRRDAARKIGVSVQTIQRRAVPWNDNAGFMSGKVRFKFLKLDDDTRQERRYYEPDVEALLVTPLAFERPAARSLIAAPLAG
jgi:hypothetical protein